MIVPDSKPKRKPTQKMGKDGSLSIHVAAEAYGCGPEVVEFLLDKEANDQVNTKDNEDRMLLHLALEKKKANIGRYNHLTYYDEIIKLLQASH